MKIKGIVFILFAACVGHIGAMESDKGCVLYPSEAADDTPGPDLKHLGSIAKTKNRSRNINYTT